MSKYTYLIDAGHGGIDVNGKYTTDYNFNGIGKGNKCYGHSDGTVIYEGEFNRKVRSYLLHLLSGTNIPYQSLNYGAKDDSLIHRVNRANQLHDMTKNCVVVSIHGNAGGGTGWEIWTSKGQTISDQIATLFYKEAEKELLPELKMRPSRFHDGDPDKESNFYILKHTDCPAILTENGFMDDLSDCKHMLDPEYQKRIAIAHFNAIKLIEQSNG